MIRIILLNLPISYDYTFNPLHLLKSLLALFFQDTIKLWVKEEQPFLDVKRKELNFQFSANKLLGAQFAIQ